MLWLLLSFLKERIFKNSFVYLFLAMVDLYYYAAFPLVTAAWGVGGWLYFIAVHSFLIPEASLVADMDSVFPIHGLNS